MLAIWTENLDALLTDVCSLSVSQYYINLIRTANASKNTIRMVAGIVRFKREADRGVTVPTNEPEAEYSTAKGFA